MPLELSQTRLPGVGIKYVLPLDGGGRIIVIQHNDGRRDLYALAPDAEEPRHIASLSDEEARRLGALLAGAYERPKVVEELELALGELQIEWMPVPDASPWIGKTLGECAFRARTGVTVIAILREPEPISGARPEDVIQTGDTLVAVGKAGQFGAFRELLAGGE
jgi:TrkA domain protein